jgi:hypothetical protein
VRVVADAGQRRVRVRHQRPAGTGQTLDRKHVETGAAEVGLEDQAIVARPDDDPVVLVLEFVDQRQSKNSFV